MRNPNANRVVGPIALVCVIVTGATVMTLRATRTDVDTSIAQMRENHTCSRCGHVFSLAVSEAVTMRRTSGNIICPKCGHRGAIKEAGLSASDMVNDMSPPIEPEEADNANTPLRPGKSTPAMNREKAP